MSRLPGATMRRAVAVLVTGLALAAGGLVSAPTADAAAPILTIERSRSTVTVYRYEDPDSGGGVYGNLGVYAVAGKKPFKVEAKRSSYKKPIKAKLVKKGKDKKLPSPTDFSGLKKFATTTYTNSAGKVVGTTSTTFCPNYTYPAPIRRRPSAPASSPYPQSCSSNPYSLGAMWGIQAGYAVPLGAGGYSGGAEELPDLPVGVYKATVTIQPAYRKALGLSKSRATVSVTVKVESESWCDEDDPECMDGMRAQAKPESVAVAATPKKLKGKRVKPSGPLPDLRSLPAWGIRVDEGRYLQFSATVWNGGPGRLVVDGFRSKKDPDLMNAYQYFFTKSGKQKGYAPVGGMEWDARDGHEHWHFQDFATYRLVDKDKKLIVRSAKEAFCLANTDAVNYLVKGANWKPENTELSTACGDRQSLGVREVLDSGSGDTYVQSLPGQSFDLRDLPNGTYYIQIKANPDKVLYEKKTKNNTSYRKVIIGGTPGDRTVKVPKVGIINEADYMGFSSTTQGQR